MNNDRIERRARMLEKVRKLLAMARDGRGNSNEEDIALRQANKLMAEFGIEEAECDMTAMDAGEMSFGEAQAGPDGRAPVQGKVNRTMPTWCNTLSLGVAKFCDAIVSLRATATGPTMIFRGEKEDVLLARWLFGALIDSVQREQRASGWTSKADANRFKVSATSALYRRLHTMHAERVAMFEAAKRESNSRALVVVDRKQTEIARLFGRQHIRQSSGRSSGDRGAGIAGQQAGQRITIPSGRPLGNQSRAMLN